MVKRLLVLGMIVLMLGLGTSTEAKQYQFLTVQQNSSGIVNSTDGQINCGSICSHGYPGWVTDVDIVATPLPGHTFLGWTGDCASAQGNVCTVTMTRDRQVGTVFTVDPPPPPPPPRSTYRVLSMGFDCPLSTDCSRPTINSIAATIRDFRPDILLVREVFWRDVGEALIGAINSNTTGYRLNYFQKRPGGSPFPSPNGGGGTLIATTDLPIENVTSYIFDECRSLDCFVNKGVIHLSVKLGTRSSGERVYLRVANTHLQSGTCEDDQEVRRWQVFELRRYINRAYVPMGQPLLFGGDFNVAQTDWAGDPNTWNYLYGAMKSWYLDSVQKMCADEGSTCQGSGQAAADFQSEVQQLFITQPDTFDSDFGGYKLIPTRYQSIPDPNHLTDHPFIIVDFAYQEVNPRKARYCISPEVSEPQASCPDNYPVFEAGGGMARCDVEFGQNCNGYISQSCAQVTDWRGYFWEGCYCFDCCCHTWLIYDPTPMTCCRMGWFKTTIRNDFNAGQINVNGQNQPSGYIFDQGGVTAATLNAVSPQTVGARTYFFDRWEKRDSAGNVVETHSSPSWTITIDNDYTYVAVSHQKMPAAISVD